MVVNPLPQLTAVNPLQPANAYLPMEVTQSGRRTEVNPMQFSNVSVAMDDALPNCTEVNRLQLEKAPLPTRVTLEGSSMLLNSPQNLKA
jgi:hypothetical protein